MIETPNHALTRSRGHVCSSLRASVARGPVSLPPLGNLERFPQMIRILNATLLAACLLGGCAQFAKTPGDFDVLPHISKQSYSSSQSPRVVFDHVRAQLEQCFAKPMVMYAPAPIPIGGLHQTGVIAESGQTAQIIFEQRGIQSFLIARLDLSVEGSGTRVNTATKVPQNRAYEPFFAMWVEKQRSGCKLE
jgi:hypothetical protein